MTNISTENLKAQLNRILTSRDFTTGKRLNQFLRYVVEQAINVQSGSIKQYSVAVEALGYGADFDPQSNPTGRILARRLRRTLEQYYYSKGKIDPIRIEIPKGAYIPVFIANTDSIQNAESSCPICPMPATTEPQVALPDGPSIAILPFEFLGNEAEHTFFANGITDEIIIALTRFQ